MNLILALETGFSTCSVALLDADSGELIDQSVLPAVRQHTKLLLPMCEQILESNTADLDDLVAVAFNRGPGAFTGLRINTASAQGLAFALGIGCRPVSSLKAIAQAARPLALEPDGAGQTAGVVSLIDARMDELYLASYRFEDDLLIEQDAEQLISLPQASSLLAERVAQGFAVFSPEAQQITQALKLSVDSGAQIEQLDISAKEVALVATTQRSVEPSLAQPVYLRNNAWRTKEQQQKTK